MYAKKTSNIVDVIIVVIFSAGVLETLHLLSLIPEGVFYSGDGGLKALLTHQFSSGNFNSNLVLSHDSWINALWNKGYFPFHEPYTYQIGNKFYMHYPIWFSLITAPFYRIFGYYGLYVVPLVSVWILWICFILLCKRYKLTTSSVCLALSALIFGSSCTLYGLQYWEHAPATVLAFMGFSGILWQFEDGHAQRKIFLSGTLLGLSGLLRPELFCFCAVVLLVWLFIALRGALIKNWSVLAAPILLCLAFFIVSNKMIYGKFMGLHAREVLDKFDMKQHLARGAEFFSVLNQRQIEFLPPMVLLFVFCVVVFFVRANTSSRRVLLSCLVVLLTSLAIPFVVPTTGGNAWGPRFLLINVPIACLAFGLSVSTILQALNRPRLKVLMLCVCGGFVFKGVFLNTFKGNNHLIETYHHRVLPLMEFVRNDPYKVIVVSDTFIAQELSSQFRSKVFFRSSRMQGLKEIADTTRHVNKKGFLYIRTNYSGFGIREQFQIDSEGQGHDMHCISKGQYGVYYTVFQCRFL